MMTHVALVEQVEAHLLRTGTSPSAFGRSIANDAHLVSQLRKGRSPQLRLVERILTAIKTAAPPQQDGA